MSEQEIKTMWMSFSGGLFDRESDAIEHCPPSMVYFCPDCGDWKYDKEAARECCAGKSFCDREPDICHGK